MDDELDAVRRGLLLAPLFGALAGALAGRADAAPVDPAMTQILLADKIAWTKWNGLPAHIGETASLFGGLKQDGPYLVLMKWHPGFMSAPHSYRTDRLSLVVSGTWWVGSGATFDPGSTVPVPAGSFVRRVAGTPHFDGVKAGEPEPAVIGLFGIGPVDMTLVEPRRPLYRAV